MSSACSESSESSDSDSSDSALDSRPVAATRGASSSHRPGPFSGSRVWTGTQIPQGSEIVTFTENEVYTIRVSVARYKVTGYPLRDITQENFPLPPDLRAKLAGINRELHQDRGFAVLRGLDQAAFDAFESAIAFVGITSHICKERAVNRFANLALDHIWDATHLKPPKGLESYGLPGTKIPTALHFHADRFAGDILATYVTHPGDIATQGEQYVASFLTIYNELLRSAPQVLEVLAAENWPFETKDGHGQPPYLLPGPVVFFANGMPLCQLVRAPLVGGPQLPRSKDFPNLSTAQRQTLDYVERLAQHHSYRLDRRQGDIQLVHNLSILHARSDYSSGPRGRKNNRHLMRMFLRDPSIAWAKPARYARFFDEPFLPADEVYIDHRDNNPWRNVLGTKEHG